MPFAAQVVRVLIASPSDVAEERDALRHVMWRWNDLHAEATGSILLPVGWETHVRPELGAHPQALIDRQLADRADVLIGLFWTRLGTPVPDADSGTVHEIKSFMANGRQALLYFSSRPMPADVDLKDVEAVRKFQAEARTWGVIGSFASQEELTERVGADLLRLVREHYNVPTEAAQPRQKPAPRIVLRVEREQRQKGVSKQGRLQYSHHTRLIMANRGEAVAEQVQLFWDPDLTGEDHLPSVIGMDGIVASLPPEAEVTFPVAMSMGSAGTATMLITWMDRQGEKYESRQSLSL